MAPILLLCRDLLLSSKIAATASAVGMETRLIRDPATLPADQQRGRLVVDLNQDGFLEAAVQWKRATGGQVIGFAGHLDVATLDRARQAGLDVVLPRGAFVAGLEGILISGRQ